MFDHYRRDINRTHLAIETAAATVAIIATSTQGLRVLVMNLLLMMPVVRAAILASLVASVAGASPATLAGKGYTATGFGLQVSGSTSSHGVNDVKSIQCGSNCDGRNHDPLCGSCQ